MLTSASFVLSTAMIGEAFAGAPSSILARPDTRPVFAECRLQHDSVHNAPGRDKPGTEGYLRLKQNYGQPLLLTGYSKYLPQDSKQFAITVNQMANDGYNDCSSTGAIDFDNNARDLVSFSADESGFSWYESTSEQMTFYGETSIMGKSLVIYALNDKEEVLFQEGAGSETLT